MKTEDFHWLCGLLEGEGSFYGGNTGDAVIAVQMTDYDVVARIAGYFYTAPMKVKRYRGFKSHWKDIYVVRKKGRGAVAIMAQLRPYMSSRRQIQIDYVLKNFRLLTYKRIHDEDIPVILQRLKTGETQLSIAKSYGVVRSTITHLKKKHGDGSVAGNTQDCGS